MAKQIPQSIDNLQLDESTKQLITNTLPWLFGTGIAAGHLLTASSCTLPQQGKCTICGGCVVALGSLVSWAVIKNKSGDNFYSQDHSD